MKEKWMDTILRLVCRGWEQILGYACSMYFQKGKRVCRVDLVDGSSRFYNLAQAGEQFMVVIKLMKPLATAPTESP